jgi:hypothetical protein
MKLLAIPAAMLAAAVVAGFPATEAGAQRNERVLIVYGNDPCPTSNGEEIVVCARRPENDRYRIPEELRGSVSKGQPSWSERAKSIEYVGRSGTNSCTPVGAGGWTGCWAELMRQAREERKANSRAAASSPAP